MNAAGRRRLSGMLMAAVVVSAAAWLLLLNGAGSNLRLDPPHPPPPLPPAVSAPPPIAASAAADPAIWQRPLFWADRQSPAGGGGDAQGGSSGELELTGVIMDGSLRVALLRDRASGKSFVLRPGTAVGRWRLLRLSPRRAVLAGSGGEQLDLPLKSASPAANPTAADAAPPGSPRVESWRSDASVQGPGVTGPDGRPLGQPVTPDHPSAIRPQTLPAGAASVEGAAARLRALRKRIDERRRQLQQNGGVTPRTTDNGAGS